MTQTVFVGLSGGVDSSVAAARLLARGYNVVGVFIKVWHPDWLVCNWEAERLDAMRVAAHLGIPFLTCNAEAEYRDAVANYFIESYKLGKTPNPDVMCNQEVKFGAFLRFALEHGADYIATGHYAQKRDESLLIRGNDQAKDQSYFLWSLSEEQLRHVLFPVGDTNKDVIRTEAEAAGLPTAQKKDSQGVCFLGHIDIPDFLSHYIDLQPGAVLNKNGEVVGEHVGAFVYTLGQRHGFTIFNKTAASTPHFVTGKDIKSNTITVDTQIPKQSSGNELILTNIVNRGKELQAGATYLAQFRYRQIPIPVEIIDINEKTMTIKLQSEVEQPASGQSCVLYSGEVCHGGGIIL